MGKCGEAYDEWGGSVHADDGPINPTKQPLHDLLDVDSRRTLHRGNGKQVESNVKCST